MRTAFTVGTGFAPLPWKDGGRLTGAREDQSTWDNLYWEAGVIAEIDVLAPVLRGVGDVPGFACVERLLKAANACDPTPFKGRRRPTFAPFFDTACLRDLNSTQDEHVYFDMTNIDHRERAWTDVIRPMLQQCEHSNATKLERTVDGRILIIWWGIQPWSGPSEDRSNAVRHWDQAWQLLNRISYRMVEEGYDPAAHIVDTSWPVTLSSYGRHDWFHPPQQSYTTYAAGEIKTGVVVPGFRYASDGSHEIKRLGGATLLNGLAACRAANCDVVIIEGLTNTEESASCCRTDEYGTRELDTIRQHVRLTRLLAPVSVSVILAPHVVKNLETKDPIPGAGVILSGGQGEGITNEDGYIAFVVSPGMIGFSVHHQQYLDYYQEVELLSNTQVEVVMKPAYLFPAEQGWLHIAGEHFYTEQNERWQGRGYSDFLLFLRFCRGEDITPDLRWLRIFGFNFVRVFGALPWDEVPDYRADTFRFDLLGAFFSLLAYYGLRCEWCPGHYRFDGWAYHLQQHYDIAQDHWNVLMNRVNEPHVGQKPDPLVKVDDRGVLTDYGIYTPYTGGQYPYADWGSIHTRRDSTWIRSARHAQECQHKRNKPCVPDEGPKVIEIGTAANHPPTTAVHPGFEYSGGKTSIDGFVQHQAICAMYTGLLVHTEEGKWGAVPVPGSNQYEVCEAIRDNVFKKIRPEWLGGSYSNSSSSGSPVDDVDIDVDGDGDLDPIWTYSSVMGDRALAVRCYNSPPKAMPGWEVIDRWGPAGSICELRRK